MLQHLETPFYCMKSKIGVPIVDLKPSKEVEMPKKRNYSDLSKGQWQFISSTESSITRYERASHEDHS